MPRWCFLLVVLLLTSAARTDSPRFFPDDPVWKDPDDLDTPKKPEELELSDMYDRFSNIFHDFGDPEMREAQNVNTLDEVPGSSWFVNRHGTRRMSIDELVRGPDTGTGPDPTTTWTVFKSKSQGITPGLEILDGKGDRYIIKFDPIQAPKIASVSEIIGTKLFYALGFNTPENYVVNVHPDRFTIRPGTLVKDRFGDTVPLTPRRLKRLLRRVPRRPDGTMRAVASKYLNGVPLGPFRYYETRTDDPNDVIAHENRRELRGLRLFAAWLNHDDTRSQNTQDSWTEENGKHFVRHYLLDFGSLFGSGSVDLQLPHLSFHYWLDLTEVKANAASFGTHTSEYHHAKWPDLEKYEAVGRFESKLFDPEKWKNDYRNPAFVRMTARDAFWAAKILMRFTRAELAAIVKTGRIEDPDQEAYFLETLVERQRKCGQAYLNRINPIDELRVVDAALEFQNLSERYGVGAAGAVYEMTWSRFGNRDQSTLPLKGPYTDTEARALLPVPVPTLRGPDDLLVLDVRTLHDKHPEWRKRVRIYLRREGDSVGVVGIERES